MTRQHYHVMTGLPGCHPASNEQYTNYRDAKRATKELAFKIHDITGGKLNEVNPEYYEIITDEAYGCGQYIALERCTDDCADDDGEW